MKTKDEYYEMVLENRKIANDPKNQKCPCAEVLCDWHGRCRECVTLHRYHKDHVPACLQSFINEKLKAVVTIGEMTAVKNEKTSKEYRMYVKEQDKKRSSSTE
jgi:hypothetical protein